MLGDEEGWLSKTQKMFFPFSGLFDCFLVTNEIDDTLHCVDDLL